MPSALQKLFLLEKEAVDFGFKWPDVESIINQIQNETQEIKDALDSKESRTRIQEELGDLIHATLSLCSFLDFDLEDSLNKLTNKFETRLALLKIIAKARNLNSLHEQSTELMLKLWNEAKKLEKIS